MRYYKFDPICFGLYLGSPEDMSSTVGNYYKHFTILFVVVAVFDQKKKTEIGMRWYQIRQLQQARVKRGEENRTEELPRGETRTR